MRDTMSGDWNTSVTEGLEFSVPTYSAPTGEVGEAIVYKGEPVVMEMADYDMVVAYIDDVEASLKEQGIDPKSLSTSALMALCMQFAYANRANDREVQYLAENGLTTAEDFGTYIDFDIMGSIESIGHMEELAEMLKKQEEEMKQQEDEGKLEAQLARISREVNVNSLRAMLVFDGNNSQIVEAVKARLEELEGVTAQVSAKQVVAASIF